MRRVLPRQPAYAQRCPRHPGTARARASLLLAARARRRPRKGEAGSGPAGPALPASHSRLPAVAGPPPGARQVLHGHGSEFEDLDAEAALAFGQERVALGECPGGVQVFGLEDREAVLDAARALTKGHPFLSEGK